MPLLPVLTIAGSDSSGGAGIQADLKAFTAIGTYGMSVVTALTAQNTYRVEGIHPVPAEFVEAQLQAVFADIRPKAAKTGMLFSENIIQVVRQFWQKNAKDIPLIVDPVLVATSGARLLSPGAEEALRQLAAEAYLVTPNLPEAALLAEMDVPQSEKEFIALGEALSRRYPQPYWLLKGGHASWEKHTVTSFLMKEGRLFQRFVQPRLNLPRPPHGTGCTLASAIAAYTARGYSAVEAAQQGLDFVHRSLVKADLALGGAAVVPNPITCD
ncbi:MAG: bifunctional hydroxymethylpyrimidine kinase/phosphomethylpyrimidine kinase [Bacteroidia bacterium]|nr:bifunctional hydroxymethylpyrimidine kinase/phosphomethylpyrimidine kinase [Bacteroidia bacterium]MCX7764320.1 bifunctional hydroxymethylpyrimidine kinase/phosphomethylpyrimidine kinase [Bacteroidia bacterium]MDW8058280.1 bifunctional hydroxymethylpyrimidine kinase/phosphomethylpyrimidine kinase [Bacteroidia bacterium]